jgi:hypothetical protein
MGQEGACWASGGRRLAVVCVERVRRWPAFNRPSVLVCGELLLASILLNALHLGLSSPSASTSSSWGW